jgi:hypothetical protein
MSSMSMSCAVLNCSKMPQRTNQRAAARALRENGMKVLYLFHLRITSQCLPLMLELEDNHVLPEPLKETRKSSHSTTAE